MISFNLKVILYVSEITQTTEKEVELVTSTKLLGLTITNDLIWNDYVTEITKKASNSVKKSGSSENRSSIVLCIVREVCEKLCST